MVYEIFKCDAYKAMDNYNPSTLILSTNDTFKFSGVIHRIYEQIKDNPQCCYYFNVFGDKSEIIGNNIMLTPNHYEAKKREINQSAFDIVVQMIKTQDSIS